MSKAELGQKLGLLCQTGSQVAVDAKEKCLKDVKRAGAGSTQIGRKKQPTTAMEEVLVAWTEDPPGRGSVAPWAEGVYLLQPL